MKGLYDTVKKVGVGNISENSTDRGVKIEVELNSDLCEQIKAKDKWIKELLAENEELKKRINCDCDDLGYVGPQVCANHRWLKESENKKKNSS